MPPLGIVYIFKLPYESGMFVFHNWRTALVAVLALVVTCIGATGGRAAELVMFEQSLCEWCERWDEEIGPIYDRTPEGKRAPIRKVDIHAERPEDLAGVKPVVYTPTFVLVHEGVEVGRILGYPGEDFFWGMLDQMLERLPAGG